MTFGIGRSRLWAALCTLLPIWVGSVGCQSTQSGYAFLPGQKALGRNVSAAIVPLDNQPANNPPPAIQEQQPASASVFSFRRLFAIPRLAAMTSGVTRSEPPHHVDAVVLPPLALSPASATALANAREMTGANSTAIQNVGHAGVKPESDQGTLVLPAMRLGQAVGGTEQQPDLPPPRPLTKPPDGSNADDKGDDKKTDDKKTDKDEKKTLPDGVLLPAATKSPPPPHKFAKICNECSRVYELRAKKPVPAYPLPKEQHLTTMPPYVIQIPDILLVESPRSLPDQPIAGEHLVRADGTINLGLYGTVRVAGLTIDEAKKAIEDHLSNYINDPKVNVDVYSYNSKFIYVIADGAGFGEQVLHLNFTGNETVLDAIAKIGGIPQQSSKRRIWIARPNPKDEKDSTILPVDWNGIVKCGHYATNYQLFPYDRLYIQSDPLQATDGWIAKMTSPIERLFGTNVLGGLMVYRYQNMGRQGFGNGGTAVITTP